MKQWYAIKKKTDKRWLAYELKPGQIKLLKRGYEYKGPFKSLMACFFDSIKHNEDYYKE